MDTQWKTEFSNNYGLIDWEGELLQRPNMTKQTSWKQLSDKWRYKQEAERKLSTCRINASHCSSVTKAGSGDSIALGTWVFIQSQLMGRMVCEKIHHQRTNNQTNERTNAKNKQTNKQAKQSKAKQSNETNKLSFCMSSLQTSNLRELGNLQVCPQIN